MPASLRRTLLTWIALGRSLLPRVALWWVAWHLRRSLLLPITLRRHLKGIHHWRHSLLLSVPLRRHLSWIHHRRLSLGRIAWWLLIKLSLERRLLSLALSLLLARLLHIIVVHGSFFVLFVISAFDLIFKSYFLRWCVG